MNTDILSKAAAQSRGISIDAVAACNSGHLGLPLGCADIGAVLFGEALQFNPKAPKWLNRDRFVLSGGHGSMFLYGWLHIAGYNVSQEDLKNFRQLHSVTPGHPEFGETDGVEATSGPLGQGVGNASGYALSAKMAMARFNTPDCELFDYHVVALAGDGCLQEGVTQEAASFAGHNGLDNLILIYDCNDVTLDAMAEVTQSEDVASKYAAMGWDVWTVDGHDMGAFLAAFEEAKAADNGKPNLIIAKTEIGRGIPEVAGTAKGHGEGGAKFAEGARKGLGLPDESFFVSDEVKAYFAERATQSAAQFEAWQQKYEAWAAANPKLAQDLSDGVSKAVPSDLLETIPEFSSDYANATRGAGGDVIQEVAKLVPMFVTGSADLFGSTKNYMNGEGDWGRENYAGRNIWFGIREHAMGAILNGVAYDGIFRPSGATFAVFADYMRGSIRLASLAKLPVTYILTHDSIGVGEDGPTHQPVETVSGLRVIPGLDVIRCADPEEVVGGYASALSRTAGPTALILTRQKVRTLNEIPVATRREGVLKGAYVAVQEQGPLEMILIASGSELQHAIDAAGELGAGVRVVSMPSMEIFDRQTESYQESVLPAGCRKRVAIEAGVTHLWHKYVGPEGRVIGIDRFGISAPGGTAMKELGITVENLVAVAKSVS